MSAVEGVVSPRVPMLGPEEAAAAAAEAGLPRSFGRLNIFRILLHNPPLAKALSDLLVTQLRNSPLDDRLRELVIMRIAWVTGSGYEWSQHWGISERLGMTAAELVAVKDWEASGHPFEPAAAVALTATDEVLATGAVSPATMAEATSVLGDPAQVVALLGAIGTWRMISEVLRSLDVTLEQGVDLWPPDGVPPVAVPTP